LARVACGACARIVAMTDLLHRLQFAADPLADRTVNQIIGTWSLANLDAKGILAANATQFDRIKQANRLMATWTSNSALKDWQPPKDDFDPQVVAALQEYLASGTQLPPWADTHKIARAEQVFFDDGPMSCILLFCASLPECYVIPDLADVLHVAGQLEKHTEYRIRSTAAMIFPVMMHGGLTTAEGGGVAQTLKVRLIHATIRHLILRGMPIAGIERAQKVAPLASLQGSQNMHQALFAHGWDTPALGLPCNQEELAYTLLTFNYVFLRGLRTLGIGLPHEDEQAYLHTWNVMAHVLGVDKALMVNTMDEAHALFADMQARGRARPRTPDVRSKLGGALIDTMQNAIKLPVVKHFPALMTRRLCGPQTSRDVGVTDSTPWFARLCFAVLMAVTRGIDTVVRLFWPQFSLSRLITRILGYHLISKVLLDQTRPLKLPDHLIHRVDAMMSQWGHDAKAPRWINAVEDALTVKGSWRSAA
jgi:ER-bound oxygenase mpaB/B'/Rubber oxygenase, catalytic domain